MPTGALIFDFVDFGKDDVVHGLPSINSSGVQITLLKDEFEFET